MKTSGKRLLSMFLALLMVLSLFPAAAFAEGEEEAAPVELETEVPAPPIEEESAEEPVPELPVPVESAESAQPEESEMTLASVPELPDDLPEKGGYAFTLVPTDTQIDPTAFTWSLTWNTDFVPHRVKIVLERENGEPVTVKTIYQNDYAYDNAGNMVYTLPATEGAPGVYHLEAYVDSTVDSPYVSSGGFTLGASNLAFTRSPADGSFDYHLLTCTLNWETNFVPLKVRVVRELEHGSLTAWSDTEPSATMGCYLPVTYGPGRYHVEAVFGSEDVYVPSLSFTVDDGQLRFIDQPQNGQIDPETLAYAVSWKTSFTPVFVELNRYHADGDNELVTYFRDDLTGEMTIPLAAYRVRPDDIFYINVYYSFSDYNSTHNHWITSNYFTLDADNLKFTASPSDCAYDPATLQTTLTWSTNFTPRWVELVNEDTEEYIRITGEPDGSGLTCNITAGLGIGSFYLRACYDAEAPRQFVESRRFTISDENLHYTAQPQDARIDYRTGLYHVSWSTNFQPQKAYIVNADNPDQLLGIYTDLDASMSFDFSPFDLGSNGQGQFYIEAVYGYYIHPEDNTSYYSWSIRSDTFGLDSAYGFVKQPQSGNVDPETLSYTVSWETNFAPTTIAVHPYDGGAYYSASRYLDENLTHTEFSWSNILEHNCYVIRAYYRDAGIEYYVDSEPFTIGTESMRFLVFPSAGPIDPETLSFTIRWKTSFDPVKLEICHYGTDGEIYVDDSTIFNTPADCTYTIAAEKMTAEGNHFVRATYGTTIGGNDNRSISSPPFPVDFAALAFVTQPQSGVYDSSAHTYALSWETNFNTKRVQICRMLADGSVQVVYDPAFAWDASYEYAMPESCGTGAFYVRAYFTDDHYVTSALFTVSDGQHVFLTQPAGGQIDLGTLTYTAHWETSFLPEKIDILYYTGDGETPQPHVLYSQQAALNAAMDYDIQADSAPNTFYIRAWYNDDDYILSSGFTVTVDGLIFTESPYLYEYDPADGSYCIFWTTSFVPKKIRVVHAAGEGLLNPVEDAVLTIGYDTHGAFLADVPDGDDTYFFYAFYGEDSQDHVTGSLRLNLGVLDFVVSPQDGQFVEGPASYPLSWTTNFVPVKVELLRTDGTVLNTLTQSMNRTMSCSLPATAGEGVYILRAYYADSESAYAQCPAFVVTYPGPMFTVIPEAGAASLETPHEIHWATSFEPTQLELCCIENGVHVTLGTLNSAATAFAIPYDMAAAHRDALFYIRAWFGEGEEDFITTPGFSVALRLEMDGLTIDALGTTHAFTPSEWDAEAYAYLTYSNNALSSDAVQYRIDFGSGTNTWIELTLLDPNWTDCLTLYIDNWNVENETLPRSLVTLDQEANEIEINTSIPYLRQLFHSYAEQHGLENPDLFILRLQVYSSGGGASFLMRDLHLPLPIDGPYIDFDSFTLTTPLTPELVFPDGAPAVTAVNSECYAVIGTVGNVWLEDWTPLYPDPAPVYESEDEVWQSYFYNTWHEVGDEYVPYPVAERFQYYFGEGYNRWVTGPSNPAPRGPANYIYGVTANHLTRSGADLASTAICLADFMNTENETYFNSLPGLSHYSWLGYFEEGEQPEDWEEVYYELLGSADSVITVTFADGVTYRGTISLFNNMGGEGDFHVVGEPYTPPVATIHSASVVLDGLIRIKYYYSIPETLLQQDGAAIVFYSDGVEVKRTPLSEGVLVTTGNHTGEYAYYYEVVAKEIRSPVTAKIVDRNGDSVTVKSVSGTDYTDGFTYSVQTYAQNKQTSDNEKLRALAKSIEDYGIAAKIYFNYGDTSGLAVSETVQAVTEADLLPYALSTEGTKPAGFTGCTITVMCEADSSLRIYFKFDGTKAPESYTYTVDGNPAELSERSDGAKYLVVRNIAAKNLGDMHTFSITDGTDTYTVTASALSYALTSVRNGNAARQNLGKALYLYYLAAQDYFG